MVFQKVRGWVWIIQGNSWGRAGFDIGFIVFTGFVFGFRVRGLGFPVRQVSSFIKLPRDHSKVQPPSAEEKPARSPCATDRCMA